MKVIYKYKIPLSISVINAAINAACIELPKGAKILTVNQQNSRLFLWAEVDPLEDLEQRYIKIIPTGEYVSDGLVYLGTTFIDEFVFHIYEEKK